MLTREQQMSIWTQRVEAKRRLAYYEQVRRYVYVRHSCEAAPKIVASADRLIKFYRALIQDLSNQIADDTLSEVGGICQVDT